jgi:acylphosphatase
LSRRGEVRRRLIVAGDVQGVGYRAACARRAHELGLTGHVRNLPDGRVEVVAEGDEGAVAALVEWCRLGPPMASVDDVEARDEPVRGASHFEVAR